jgi:hypothetical protein
VGRDLLGLHPLGVGEQAVGGGRWAVARMTMPSRIAPEAM